MKTAKEQVENLIECNCDEMYKSRGLSAPDCPQCNYAEDVIKLMESYAKQKAVEFAEYIENLPMYINPTSMKGVYDEWIKPKE